MYKLNRISVLLIFLILVFSGVVHSQYIPGKERGDAKLRTKGQMEGNQIRTTVFNHGQTGRYGGVPIQEQTPYEWPKNTGHVYLALQGILVGGEVVDDQGTTQRIIDVMNYRTSPQGKSWNFEPAPGYYNTSNSSIWKLATSNDKNTWPNSWPDKINDANDPGWAGKWNGYFGKDVFNADQEMFYRASDDSYDRYAFYFPDTTDLSRKGLGILLDVRVMAWSQILVQDVLYNLNYVKNDGTEPINRVGVTMWYADFVGGDGDSQDDISDFDLLEDIAWTKDKDNKAQTFGSDPVGAVAMVFLETPGNAFDRIDNDGDGETNGPKVTEEMLIGESDASISDSDPRRTDGIDNNGNGLIDENKTHIPFNGQVGVTYADRIDQNGNAEANSPVVTQEMVNQSSGDKWKRWPAFPENDAIQDSIVHLIMVESDDVGFAFADNIDNNDNGEEGSPIITQEMINQAANDAPYFRFIVPDAFDKYGKPIILYNLKQESLGKKYTDGKDNDNNGAIDEFIDEGIDEMVDEARNDGIDNDDDWNSLTDDVGLDGVPDTQDPGEGDGKPTSGAKFGLPGEPNIDVTDVSETDQIGITNADYLAAGGLNINSDATMWFNFMIPGKFYDPQEVVAGEYDLFVSSSYFPLRPGQVEPYSIAIILANGPQNDPNGNFRKQEILRKRLQAQETYNNDYQFANAPITPKLTAIPGDNKVTLYWDDEAEKSFDKYINNIGGNGNDFEGYRIYRSSDPAFEDPLVITNAQGSLIYKLPIAQFDLKDGITGYDSIGLEGVHFYLGDDSGIKHEFVDTTVQNGFTYYYAITSYDFGYNAGGILPAESPIRISLQPDGSVITGSNVVVVKPEAPAAGYIAPSLGNIALIQGNTTGQIYYDVVDPSQIKNEHVYFITFEDTLIKGQSGKPDTLKTKNYSLFDSTANVLLIDKSKDFGLDIETPLIDGFRLKLVNESRVELNTILSKWNNPESIPSFIFEKFVLGNISGNPIPNDYKIIFDNLGVDTSTYMELRIGSRTYKFPAKPVNFKIYNNTNKKFIDFLFIENDSTSGDPGLFSANKDTISNQRKVDYIVFYEQSSDGQDTLFTWQFYLSSAPNEVPGFRNPQVGDTATIVLRKPFLSGDKFRFVAQTEKIDNNLAKTDLERIKVVPNPYLANASWEPRNPYTSGRGPRAIHFTHLPNKCTIRIFTVNGELVKTIEVNNQASDGTAEWDLLSEDRLSVSYGVYIYHVDAPGIGEKVGKFAIIK